MIKLLNYNFYHYSIINNNISLKNILFLPVLLLINNNLEVIKTLFNIKSAFELYTFAIIL